MKTDASSSFAVRPSIFFGMAIVWLAAAYLIGNIASNLPFGITVLSVLFLAIPIMLSGAYTGAISQVRTLSTFNPSGWIFSLLSKRLLKILLWGLWALLSSFFVLLQLILYTHTEWIALLLCIPVFWITVSISQRMLVNEIKKPYLITDYAIRLGRGLTPVLMVIVYLAITSLTSHPQDYGSLHDAIAAQRTGIPNDIDSNLVATGLHFFTFSDGIKGYAFSKAAEIDERILLLLVALGSYIVFLNTCTTLASFLIPAQEYRRVFGTPSDDDVPPPLSKSRIAWTSALITFGILFVYLPLFASLESHSRNNPASVEAIKKVELAVEQIDDHYFARGTSEQLRAIKFELLRAMDISHVRLEAQIDRSFDTMESNVDRYLDWYYSLGAEYLRLVKLLSGGLDAYLEENLAKHLQTEELSAPINAAFDTYQTASQASMAAFESRKQEIMARNRISADGQSVRVVETHAIADLLSLPVPIDHIQFQQRTAASGIGAGIGAAITAKIVGKGALKTAGKAIVKVVTSKSISSATGAATGAAIGSVVPVIGTAVGAALGAIAGGFMVDKVLLSLEEIYNREQFKQEIIDGIRDAKQTMKAELFPPKPAL